MNRLIRTTLALAVGMLALPAFAAAPSAALSADVQAAHAAAVTSSLHVSHVRAAAPATSGLVQPKVMGSQTQPGTPAANPFRAYPPSCAADPLPDRASGPTVTARVPLYALDSLNQGHVEMATVSVWRLPCSSSGTATPYNPSGFANAMTLMRIDRDNDSDTTLTPRFPLVQVSQGGLAFTDARTLVRAAIEPNTVVSETPFDSALLGSTTYVLENYPYTGSGYFTFSDSFVLRIDPQVTGVAPVDIGVQAYTGAGISAMPITGYLSSAWYDTAHSGEGLLIEMLDNPDGVTHTVFAAWYTYDALGLPYWLVAQGVVQPGITTLTNAPVYYYTGGGFAGNFGASADSHVWGTMSMTFPDCNTIDFSFSGSTADSSGPSGTGSREWHRLANINGLTCE
ncbi:MAG: hypothetical protein ABJB02_02935 [Dokdonella sp.]